MRTPGNEQTALRAAKAWAEANACASVRSWMADSEKAELPFGYQDCGQATQGWVRWGFTLAFWHLRRKTPFVQALHEVRGRAFAGVCPLPAFLGALALVERLGPHPLNFPGIPLVC